MNNNQAWVLAELTRLKRAQARELVANANGILYPRNHQTLWRRVDRAIQALHRNRKIEFNGKFWRAV